MSERFTRYIGFGYLSYGCRAPALSPKGRPLRTVCHFVWCHLAFDIPKKMQASGGKKARILAFFPQKLEFYDFGTFPVSYKESEDTDRFVLTSNT